MGRPKAWLPFAGELMLPRIVRVVGEAVGPRVVVAAPGQELPPLPAGVDVAYDEQEGRGPLQGLAAGLAALGGRVDGVYLSSCDVPFLLPGFIRRLIELTGDYSACVPHVDGRYHSLAAVYRLDVLPVVRQFLAANQLRSFSLFEAISTRVVEAKELTDVDPTLRSLQNLNTPADYEAALRQAAEL
jgi:molybdopterin-guanine dinucleotide biosynthesis protein A